MIFGFRSQISYTIITQNFKYRRQYREGKGNKEEAKGGGKDHVPGAQDSRILRSNIWNPLPRFLRVSSPSSRHYFYVHIPGSNGVKR